MTSSRILCLAFVLGVVNQVSQAEMTLYMDPLFGVQRAANLVYGQAAVDNGAGVKDLQLDVYQPTDIGVAVPQSRPTMMWIHGGGWHKGTKQSVAQRDEWVTRGYNIVSISYRLAGDTPPLTAGPANEFAYLGLLGDGQYGHVEGGLFTVINASLEDASLALDWMHANADTYGFDTDRIGIAGTSAGAVMALAMGHIVAPENVELKAVLSNVGALFNDPSPFTPGGPPTMLITGERDRTVPATLVQLTRDQMNEVGIETEFYLQPNTGHQTNWDTVFEDQTLSQHGVDFLYKHLALATVPEPTSALFLVGTGALACIRRRRT